MNVGDGEQLQETPRNVCEKLYDEIRDAAQRTASPDEPLAGIVKSLEIYSTFATRILATRIWIGKGCPSLHDGDRQLQEWAAAEKWFAELLQLPLQESLQVVNDNLAHLLWHYRGRKDDDNHERRQADYFDAKRLLGFMLTEAILNECSPNRSSPECLPYLRKEFIDYLVSLSVEECIRFRAYFDWEKKGASQSGDVERMNADYIRALDEIQKTMRNCRGRSPQEYMQLKNASVVLDYVSSIDSSRIKAIKKAKKFAGVRLSYLREPSVEKYVDSFYSLLQRTGQDPNAEDIEEVIRALGADNHIPNMLEFVLRCLLCTYIPRMRAEAILGRGRLAQTGN